MTVNQRIITNAEILEIEMAVPPGHRHLRTTLHLQSGETLVLQEATVANLLRAYVGIKTHPVTEGVRLTGRFLAEGDKKPGFADWQLLEE